MKADTPGFFPTREQVEEVFRVIAPLIEPRGIKTSMRCRRWLSAVNR